MVLQGKTVVMVPSGDLKTTPADRNTDNVTARRVTFEIQGDGTINGKTVIDSRGVRAEAYKAVARNLTTEGMPEYVRAMTTGQRFKGDGSIEFTGAAERSDAMHLSATYTLSGGIDWPGSGSFEAPAGFFGYEHLSTQVSRNVLARTRPIDSGFAETLSEEYEIKLPATMKVIALPADVRFKNEIASFDATYRRQGQTVFVTRKLVDLYMWREPSLADLDSNRTPAERGEHHAQILPRVVDGGLLMGIHRSTCGAQAVDPVLEKDIIRLMQVDGSARAADQIATVVSRGMINEIWRRWPDMPQRVADIVTAVVREKSGTFFGPSSDFAARMVPLYAKHFTPDEIRGLLAFYDTALGRKIGEVMPTIAQEAAVGGEELGKRLAIDVRSAIEMRLKAEGLIATTTLKADWIVSAKVAFTTTDRRTERAALPRVAYYPSASENGHSVAHKRPLIRPIVYRVSQGRRIAVQGRLHAAGGSLAPTESAGLQSVDSPYRLEATMRRTILTLVVSVIAAAAFAAPQATAPKPAAKAPAAKKAGMSAQAKIRLAMSAGPADVAKDATIMDWPDTPNGEMKQLRAGTNGWTCFPSTPVEAAGQEDPMCLDKTFSDWANAWMAKKDPDLKAVGIGYMLRGDKGGSNTDPFATAKTADNQWIVTPAHMMVVVPNTAQLEGLPTDPHTGGPWVMWKGTKYAHVMVPIAPMAKAPAKKQP